MVFWGGNCNIQDIMVCGGFIKIKLWYSRLQKWVNGGPASDRAEMRRLGTREETKVLRLVTK